MFNSSKPVVKVKIETSFRYNDCPKTREFFLYLVLACIPEVLHKDKSKTVLTDLIDSYRTCSSNIEMFQSNLVV